MASIIRDVAARWALWHVTSRCNIECQYCYGSFEGRSYKADWQPGRELNTQLALEVPWGLHLAGYDKVHINGGEPLLRPDVVEIVIECHKAGLGTWLLTNGTVRRRVINILASCGALELLAVSLDTNDINLGDSVRDLTSRALTGLSAALDARCGSDTRIGVYVVLTNKNIMTISDLFTYLEDAGVDYVNVQPVYLPVGHSRRDELGIADSERGRVAEVMDDLASRRFDCTVGNVRSMAVATLGAMPAPVEYCFAAAGDYAYISPTGLLLGCPSKPSGSEIGRIFADRRDLAEILRSRRSRSGRCQWQGGDCLGMYEMASRDGVVTRNY